MQQQYGATLTWRAVQQHPARRHSTQPHQRLGLPAWPLNRLLKPAHVGITNTHTHTHKHKTADTHTHTQKSEDKGSRHVPHTTPNITGEQPSAKARRHTTQT